MKSFKKVVLLLSLIVVCSFILYGCIDNNITYEYKVEISIYFLEPIDMGHQRYNDGSGYSYETANVKYMLSGKLSKDQRNGFVPHRKK